MLSSSAALSDPAFTLNIFEYILFKYPYESVRGVYDLEDNTKSIYQLALWSSQTEKKVWELLKNAFYFH